MLRLILRLRPSSGLRCPRALPAGPAALSSRSAPGTSCLRRLHYGAGSRAASLDSGFSYRATLLRSPQLASGCQCKRFYSLPPHQKVTLPEPVSGCYSTHVHRVSWFDLPACYRDLFVVLFISWKSGSSLYEVSRNCWTISFSTVHWRHCCDCLCCGSPEWHQSVKPDLCAPNTEAIGNTWAIKT